LPDLFQRPGRAHRKALGIVHTDLAQFLQHRAALDRLRHDLLAHDVADIGDGAHHLAVDRIADDVADEQAVDLQKIDRQRF